MLRLGTAGCLGALLLASALEAQTRMKFEDYTLDNGLRVLLAENHAAPVVTVNIWYDVGSRNEVAGHSGFAHLFEHMMFQGSAHVAKAEHAQLVERAGGTMNGTTSPDRTNYYETLPSNRLNLGLWLEADRMRSLAVTQENLDNQREVVKEERRLSYENQPYALSFLEASALVYDSAGCFGYGHTNIGSMKDLNAAKVEEVKAFFDRYYVPNNATLTIAGDFDAKEAKSLIEQYFGDIPRGPEHGDFQCSYEFGSGARSRTWVDEHANLPAVVIAYRIPPHSTDDTRALRLLSTILGSGESSRLNRALVREAKSAVQALSQVDSRRGPGMFLTIAIANQGTDAKTLETQLTAEVRRIVDEGVTNAEIQKAKNDFRSGYIFGVQTSMQQAERLQHYIYFHNKLSEINTDLDDYMKVTAADVQQVAGKYLVPANSFAITIVPKAAAGQGAVP
ncbi:MAG: M16 family metallopeptidase [Gemmatimonadales bacterium]